MAMHRWTDDEAVHLSRLISRSSAPYRSLHNSPVSIRPRESLLGWVAVRPCAEYDITTNSQMKKRKLQGSNVAAAAIIVGKPKMHPSSNSELEMGGYLDETFSYVYTGGLSPKAYTESPMHHFQKEPPKKSTPIVYLDPVIPYRCSAQMDTSTRSDLSNIIAMQLKPELLVEQIIIENRLRTLDMTSFPTLNLEGIAVDKKTIRELELRGKLPTKSISAPSLISRPQPPQQPHPEQQQHRQHRKTRRRLTKPRSLLWCSINTDKKDDQSLLQPTIAIGRNITGRVIGEVRDGFSQLPENSLQLDKGSMNYQMPLEKQKLSGLLGIGSMVTSTPGNSTMMQLGTVTNSPKVNGNQLHTHNPSNSHYLANDQRSRPEWNNSNTSSRKLVSRGTGHEISHANVSQGQAFGVGNSSVRYTMPVIAPSLGTGNEYVHLWPHQHMNYDMVKVKYYNKLSSLQMAASSNSQSQQHFTTQMMLPELPDTTSENMASI